jgi:hypothetical protein
MQYNRFFIVVRGGLAKVFDKFAGKSVVCHAFADVFTFDPILTVTVGSALVSN